LTLYGDFVVAIIKLRGPIVQYNAHIAQFKKELPSSFEQYEKVLSI